MVNVYEWAQDSPVEITRYPLPKTKSTSMPHGDACIIGIDLDVREGSCEERTLLAHELGHCHAGAFYNIYSPYDVRSKHEHRANRCAFEKLLPHSDILKCMQRGRCELWQLAEDLGYTEDFIAAAIQCYIQNYGLSFPEPL